MINKNLLKAKILEKGFRTNEIAEALGISLTSLNYKLNEKTQFKASEIQTLSTILDIQDKKDEYFFT